MGSVVWALAGRCHCVQAAQHVEHMFGIHLDAFLLSCCRQALP